MKLLTLLYVFCLFYVFIPGNVFKLPIKTTKMNIILIHALLFSVILSCTYGLVENVQLVEGMSGAHTHDEKDIKKTESKEPKGPTNQKKPTNQKELNVEKEKELNVEKEKKEEELNIEKEKPKFP